VGVWWRLVASVTQAIRFVIAGTNRMTKTTVAPISENKRDIREQWSGWEMKFAVSFSSIPATT